MPSERDKGIGFRFSLRDLFLFTVGASVTAGCAGYGYRFSLRDDLPYSSLAMAAFSFSSIPVWSLLLFLSGRGVAASLLLWVWLVLAVVMSFWVLVPEFQ